MKKFLIALAGIIILALACYFSWGKGFEDAQPKIDKHEDIAQKYDVLNDGRWSSIPIENEVGDQWTVALKSGARLTIKTDGNNAFTCDGRAAQFLPYYSRTTPNSLGGWDRISVVDCGANYFIYEFGDGGPHLFGPFTLATK